MESNTTIIEVEKAEEIFQVLVSKSRPLGSSDDHRFSACTLKELAEQVGITVRDLHGKLRLLRSCKMLFTYRATDGYAFFLKAPFALDDQSRRDNRLVGALTH